jgi:hypothetical protein
MVVCRLGRCVAGLSDGVQAMSASGATWLAVLGLARESGACTVHGVHVGQLSVAWTLSSQVGGQAGGRMRRAHDVVSSLVPGCLVLTPTAPVPSAPRFRRWTWCSPPPRWRWREPRACSSGAWRGKRS